MKNIFLLLLIFQISIYAQSIVINKFFNSGKSNGQDDALELLVIEKDLNLQGMLIKDFSSSMNNDNGGKFVFTSNPLWEKIPRGTLIVIRVSNQSLDTDTSDYMIDVGLKDTLYFRQLGTGIFDIASTELVMIKSAGSDTAGIDGSIHAFAAGSAGNFFNLAPSPKLRSPKGTGTGKFAYAKNSTASLSDFDGTDADTSSTLTLGQPNNETNTAFISYLRTGQTYMESDKTTIKEFELFDNFPNPFNASTRISFRINKDDLIELNIYNLLGNLVTNLAKGYYKSGVYNYTFDGSSLSSGVYIYQLKTSKGIISKKMIMIK